MKRKGENVKLKLKIYLLDMYLTLNNICWWIFLKESYAVTFNGFWFLKIKVKLWWNEVADYITIIKSVIIYLLQSSSR